MRIVTHTRRASRGFTYIGWLLAAVLILASSLALGGELADPTRPAFYKTSPNTAESAPGSMRVEAVLTRGGQRLAIVDGKVVRAGDQIGAARIDEVLADGVRYTRAGATQVARLSGARLQVRRSAPAQESAQ